MSLFDKTLTYFKELSRIPRKSHQEEKVRKWLISWAKSHNWEYEEDAIGNLLIRAKNKNTQLNIEHGTLNINDSILCLQSHMDMVCVSREPHDWNTEGVTVIEGNGILKGNGTTLGADNGIGVAVMMAIAELEERPNLELLFTMGEEVGLIGAHHITLPITAPYGINLDWCHSEYIGIGCGGTLLIEGQYNAPLIKARSDKFTPSNEGGSSSGGGRGDCLNLNISGMRGGHSGVDIDENRGNALIELAKILTEREDIEGIGELLGGDADNAIPRSAHAKILFQGDRDELHNWAREKMLEIQTRTDNTKVEITIEETDHDGDFHEKHILHTFVSLDSGVETWGDDNIALSSWNLGKMELMPPEKGVNLISSQRGVGGILKWCYFIRTNIPGGIEPMKQKILSEFNSVNLVNSVNFELSHESPVYLADTDSPFVEKILTAIESVNGKKIPAVTTHATVEVGTLAEKYPDTEWISIGATCHDMHTTREHIHLTDLEEFCQRMERIIGSF